MVWLVIVKASEKHLPIHENCFAKSVDMLIGLP